MMKFDLISGIVTDLVVNKGYENMLFTPETRDLAGVSAVAAAAFGETLGATVLAGASQTAEIPMEFFTCTIGTELVHGRFFKIEFNNGELIDFAVNRRPRSNEVCAARDPLKRIVWTLPLQSKGHYAQRNSNIKWSLLISLGVSIISMLFVFHEEDMDISSLDTVLKVGASFLGFALFMSYRICGKFFQNGLDVTEILEKFNFANPAYVDLQKNNSKAERRYAVETGQQPLSFENCRFRYDSSALVVK